MVKYTMAEASALLVALLMILALAPYSAAAQASADELQQPGSTISGTLAPGQSEVFNFGYPGDLSEIHFTLTYNPAASTHTFGTVDGPTLQAFSPKEPGTAVGDVTLDTSAGSGSRLWVLKSRDAGTWTIVVTNADLQNRPVQFTLSSGAASGAGQYALPGPVLTPVSLSQ